MTTGDRVRVKHGWGYETMDPIAFHRAISTICPVEGRIEAMDRGRIYIRTEHYGYIRTSPIALEEA